jgi:photosystem II stability/assembly factor-like uncharacterized protein
MLLMLLACIGDPAPAEPTPDPTPEPPTVQSATTSGWTRLNPALSGSELHDITGSGPLGFAVGDDGIVLRTLDGGRTWTALPPPTRAALRAVATTPEAVWIGGEAGALLRSTDQGETWQSLDSGTTEWIIAADGRGDHVVVATEPGTLLAGTAGAALTAVPITGRALDVHVAEDGWLILTAEALLWVSPTSDPTQIYTPPKSYRLQDMAVTTAGVDLLARTYERDYRNTSWAHLTRPTAPTDPWTVTAVNRLDTRLISTQVIVRGKGWLAIGGDGHDSWRSTDEGGTWERAWSKGDLSALYSLHTREMWMAEGGLFAAAGVLLSSADRGHDWSVVDGRPVDLLRTGRITPDGTLWIAAAHTIVRARDGIWERIGPSHESLFGGETPQGINGDCLDLVVTAAGTVITAGKSGMWRATIDGSRWKHAHPDGYYRALVDTGSAVVALGHGAARSTNDGRTWTRTSKEFAEPVWAAAHAGSTIWGVGDVGLSVVSDDDGATWRVVQTDVPGLLADVAMTDSAVIAVGRKGVILRLGPDETWQPVDSGTEADLNAVWHDAATGQWVAVGSGGAALVSADGDTWGTSDTGTSATLYGLMGDGKGKVVAVGDTGTVLQLGGGGARR